MSLARLPTAAVALWYSQPRFKQLVQVAGALVFVSILFPPSCSPSGNTTSNAGQQFFNTSQPTYTPSSVPPPLPGQAIGAPGATAAPAASVLQLAPIQVKPGMSLDQVEIRPGEPDTFAKPKGK